MPAYTCDRRYIVFKSAELEAFEGAVSSYDPTSVLQRYHLLMILYSLIILYSLMNPSSLMILIFSRDSIFSHDSNFLS